VPDDAKRALTEQKAPSPPKLNVAAPGDYSYGYSGKQENFEAVYVYEIDKNAGKERITRPISTIRTKAWVFLAWGFGFLSGLACNYVSSYVVDKFKFWH